MTKASLAKFAKSVQLSLHKHSPEILTGIGIAGMISTTVLAVKATPKALQLIDEAKKVEHKDKLTPIETVKIAWKPYIPAMVTGVASVTCLVGASSVSLKRNAALTAAYKLSETALTEYREKVVETIGEKKEKVVREKIAEDRLATNPVEKGSIYMTDKGHTLCFEPLSARYFYSDIDKIKGAINNLNEKMLNDPFGYLSLNDLYDELGLESTSQGDSLGWNISSGIIRWDFHPKLTPDNEPALVLDYINAPTYGYASFS